LETPRFTQRQLEFLSKHLREFAFLLHLHEDFSPAQIAKKFALSPQVLERILIQLEKHDLIRVGTGGRIKPAHEQFPNIGGPLAMATIRVQIERLAQYFKIKITDNIARRERGAKLPPGDYSWSVTEMTEETYVEFLEKFRRELKELAAQSKLDSRLANKPNLKKAVISFAAQLEEPSSPHLHLVSEIFDEYLRSPGG
jgi:DNA-binding transcriptional regulator LsrR (DeoR family)